MASIIVDDFLVSSDTALESHGDYSGANTTGFTVYDTEDAVKNETAGQFFWLCDLTPGNADQTNTVVVRTVGVAGGDRAGPCVRHTGESFGTTEECYFAFILGEGNWFHRKMVNGTASTLASGAISGFSAATEYELELKSIGTTQTLTIDSVEKNSQTDSDATATGFVGGYGQDVNAYLTSINASDTSGAAGNPWYYYAQQ